MFSENMQVTVNSFKMVFIKIKLYARYSISICINSIISNPFLERSNHRFNSDSIWTIRDCSSRCPNVCTYA